MSFFLRVHRMSNVQLAVKELNQQTTCCLTLQIKVSHWLGSGFVKNPGTHVRLFLIYNSLYFRSFYSCSSFMKPCFHIVLKGRYLLWCKTCIICHLTGVRYQQSLFYPHIVRRDERRWLSPLGGALPQCERPWTDPSWGIITFSVMSSSFERHFKKWRNNTCPFILWI